MRFLNKLNLKKFLPLSVFAIALSVFLLESISEFYVIVGVYLATLVNLIMLVELIMELTRVSSDDVETHLVVNRDKLIILFIGKVLILILALTIGVQIIGNRIIIAVINYVIQIFILVLSLKEKS